MTLGSDDPAVASLGIMDDWDESDRAKVNPIVGQAGIAAGSGNVGVTVPRMTLAGDDPAVVSLKIIEAPALVDDAAFTLGATRVMMAGVIRDDELSTLLAVELDAVPMRVGSTGALWVDAASVVPGTGATNLGKAIDSAVGPTDTGVAMLAVHSGDASKLSVAEEDYDHLHIGELGGLFVEPEQHNHLDEFDATTGWTVLGNDAANLATTKKHLTGTDALTFDKVDGAANTVIAGIQKTITTLDMGELDLHDIVQTNCYLSSLAAVAYVFVRVGTDSTNYNEWRVLDTDLVAGEFITLGIPIGGASHTGITGNGVDWGAISYIAVGVVFDNQNDTLAGIIFDQLGLFTNLHSTASLSAEVSSEVSSPNVNVKKWGSQNVTLNAGNADAGTLRVVLATDQASLTVDNGGTFAVQVDGDALTALQLLDNVVRAEDVASSGGHEGNVVMLIRDDALVADAEVNADGDYTFFRGDNFGALWTHPHADNLGGCKMFTSVDLDQTEEDISTVATTIYCIYVWNLTAAPLWLQLFNTNTVTVGTTAPTNNFMIPANADSDGAGVVHAIPVNGLAYSTALTVAITTGSGTNSGAPGAGDAGIAVYYQD